MAIGVGGKGNAGVAGVIKNTPGSIGYVNQSYIDDVVRPAALQNKLGDFVLPSVDAGAKALNGITLMRTLQEQIQIQKQKEHIRLRL